MEKSEVTYNESSGIDAYTLTSKVDDMSMTL